MNDKLYKSKKWDNVRASILVRDKYMCQSCLAAGHMVNAECVHHIFPLQQYPEYATERWNLISLCNICHNEMHNRFTDELSKKGQQLLKQKAAKQGIRITPKKETILVIGLSGSGKTHWVKNNMDFDSLVYDLDAIASAFRLRAPHEEYHKASRKMANDFMQGFIAKAHDYAAKVFIIRTAPTIKEFEMIKPNTVVICKHQYTFREMDDRQAARDKINAVEKYCEANNIEVVRY